ncbi:MAG: Hint domain-containing protein [Pseudomonadota bacterium]
MVDVTGSDNIGGTNQSAENNFDGSLFWFEWIELAGTSTSNLSEAGFDISNGDLGPGQTVFNAGGFDAVNVPAEFGQFGDDGSDFAVRVSTTLTVTTGGVYTFEVGSDDGSRLYVDGVEVVENDGLQPFNVEQGTVTLAPGEHEIVIIFFERAGAQQLQSTISGPDTGGATIDLAAANVQANAGSDSIESGAGDDTVLGGDGDDTIFAGAGDDSVDGGTGADEITGGSGNDTISGDDGDDVILGDGPDGGITLTRQSFQWDEIPDPNGGGGIDDGDSIEAGTSQDTGLITVDVSFASTLGDADFAFDTFTANTADIDSGGAPIATDSSGQIFADTQDASGTATFDFSANTAGIEDEVRNLSFRINDIDSSGAASDPFDSVTVRAFNAAGDLVEVSLVGGANLTLTDTDAAPGADTATQSAGAAGVGTTVANSLLVNIAGPVARLEVDFTGSDDNVGGVRITDIFFDAVAIPPDTVGGDDSLLGGEGADTIEGGQGDDTIEGGIGDDVLTDVAGSNSIDGGDGNDSVFVTGIGDNTVLGGDGDDTITVFVGGLATNTIDGGSGNDLINAGDSADTITGDIGNDTLDGGAGADSVDGGDGDDTLIGFTGEDTIVGGAGDDNITAGDDADIIDGGADNDTLDGGGGSDAQTGGDGFDVFLVSDGDDTITDFNTGAGQDFDDGDQTNNDFIDLAPFYDDLFELRDDLDDDGLLNQSNTGAVLANGVVDFSDNTALPGTIELTGTSSSDLFFDNTNLICFTAGTLIATPAGDRPIQDLAIGDLVDTLDHGPQPIRWIGRRRVAASGRMAPVRIASDALGAERDLLVSQQHRMLMRGWQAAMLFGKTEVFVTAKHLVDGQTIFIDETLDEIEYVHVLFDAHEIVFAEGAPSESLLPGPCALDAVHPEAREELLALFPELADITPDDTSNVVAARLCLKSHETRLLLKYLQDTIDPARGAA